MVSITLKGLWIVSDRLLDFWIFRQISQVRTCKNFQFLNYHGACLLSTIKATNQLKDLINMVNVTLEGSWMVSD